jgi:mannose-6-phosphate isomerase-like protein (cupin superfamily)
LNSEIELDLMQINIEQACQEWEARGFSCDIWSDPPGQIWANFVHPTDELVMLLEGEFELEYASRCIRPQVGEEVLIPAGVSHTVRNIGDCQNHWLYGYRKEQG